MSIQQKICTVAARALLDEMARVTFVIAYGLLRE